MRVKEYPMRNGQLKPAYNFQIAMYNQFVLGYDVYQNPTDTRTLIPFLEKLSLPKRAVIVADAGYGYEKNYRYPEDEYPEQTALIPYKTMNKVRNGKATSEKL